MMRFAIRAQVFAAALLLASTSTPVRADDGATPLHVVRRIGSGVALVMHVHTSSLHDAILQIGSAATRYFDNEPQVSPLKGSADTAIANFRATYHGSPVAGMVGAQLERDDVLGLIVYDSPARIRTTLPQLLQAAQTVPVAPSR